MKEVDTSAVPVEVAPANGECDGLSDRQLLQSLKTRFEQHAADDRTDIAALRSDFHRGTNKQTVIISFVTAILGAIATLVHAFIG